MVVQTRHEISDRRYARKLVNIIIPESPKVLTSICWTLYAFIKLNSRGGVPAKTRRVKTASETVRGLEYDHDFVSTSGARFHTDHANLAIGVVPITTGKLSEILCSLLVGGRDTVIK